MFDIMKSMYMKKMAEDLSRSVLKEEKLAGIFSLYDGPVAFFRIPSNKAAAAGRIDYKYVVIDIIPSKLQEDVKKRYFVY